MKIKLLDTVVIQFADKPRVMGHGDVVELDAALAKPLLDSKLAEAVVAVEAAVAKPKTSKACARIQPLESAD